MNAVIYASRGGNTKRLAEAIANGAGVAAKPVGEETGFDAPVELLFVGGSLYAGKIDGGLRNFLQALTSKQVKKVAVFGTAAGNKSALPEVQSILQDKGIIVSKEPFQCRGSFLLANRNRPNEQDCSAAAEFAKTLLLCERNSEEEPDDF